ncbi:MAG: TetR/AcrR family transcriptional regulator [Chitinophagales bacterium]|nr:TetR/AcrR family transcriptional regulator [Chitinophagales bacterium]
MDDIAREMGMSKKTLYQYFDNKTDLLEQIFLQHIEDEKEMMGNIKARAADAIEEIVEVGRYVVSLLREVSPTAVYDLQKYYWSIWVELEALHKQYIYESIRENILWGIKQGFYRSNLDADIIAKLFVGKTSLIVDEEMFPAKDYQKGELFQEFINYHIQGIASVKGRQLLEKYQAIEKKPS